MESGDVGTEHVSSSLLSSPSSTTEVCIKSTSTSEGGNSESQEEVNEGESAEEPSSKENSENADKKKKKQEENKENVDSVSTLKSGSLAGPSSTKFKSFKPPENWANAPEFVPRWLATPVKSISADDTISSDDGSELSGYAQDVNTSETSACASIHAAVPLVDSTAELCPYAMIGECRYGFKCLLIHGLKCDYCGQSCLHPSDQAQRERHMKECVEQHEKDMELSFAVARSIDKVCGICYEKVMSKNPPGEQRFGILPSCNHCYCLSCIRRWRQERQFDNKTIRACPECRVTSDFVCPSRYWVDNKEEKDKLIGSYKVALSKKPCRYYRSGEGQCPFGNKCFYLHALPDGTVVDVGPPRRISGAQGRVRTTAQTLSIWEYIEEWEMQWLDLEDFMGLFDSDTTSEFSLPDMDDDLGDDDELFLDWDRM